MDKLSIFPILDDWNGWNKPISAGIERPRYLNKALRLLKTNQILVITGARRSGKSFIMRQIMQHLHASGIPKNELLFINFEDPRLGNLNVELLTEIYDFYTARLSPRNKPFFFLDEIQEVNGWERWVVSMQELSKAHFIISGSNAKLLGKELGTLLTGRHVDLTVYPLDFNEYLLFTKAEINANQAAPLVYLEKYLEDGGFPEVALSGERRELMIRYFDDILNKDATRRTKIYKPEQLRSMARYLLSNSTSPLTFRSLGKVIEISPVSAEKFSSLLEDAFLISFLKRFSFKVKEQEKSPRKVYAIDNGLAGAAGFQFSANLGRRAENATFLELLRRGKEIYYWKDEQHHEVDFVIKNGQTVEVCIQVAWDISASKTREREVKSLLKALTELNLKEGLILTGTFDGIQELNHKKIRFMRLADWLINSAD